MLRQNLQWQLLNNGILIFKETLRIQARGFLFCRITQLNIIPIIKENKKNSYIYFLMVPHRILFFFLFLLASSQQVLSQDSPVDSLKAELAKAKHDTTRCNILNQMIEEEPNDTVWPVYNDQLKRLAESNLSNNNSPTLRTIYLKHLATAYNNIGYRSLGLGEINKAADNYLKCAEIQKQLNNKKDYAITLSSIGNVYRYAGNNNNALKYLQDALKIHKEIKNPEGEGACLYFIGWVYDNMGDISTALSYYNMSLKIQERLSNEEGLAQTLNNIAYIYNGQGNTKTAIEFYTRSLHLYEKKGDRRGIAAAMNNLGNIYYKTNELDKAISSYNKSYDNFKIVQDKHGIGYILNNLGNVWNKKGDLGKAMDYYEKSLIIRKEINDYQGISMSSANIGEIFYKQDKLKEAQNNAEYGLKIAKSINYPEGLKATSALLYRIYEKQNKGMPALEMYRLYIQMRDSINNIATQKAVITQYARHTYEKKFTEDSVRVAEEKKLTALQLKQEKTQKYSLYIGLALVLLFLAFLFNRFKITQKQKLIIEKQKEVVDHKQKEILESISYAKRLQEAILPPLSFVKEHLPSSFILYQPKDIVAGDFYWAEQSGNLFFIAAADSTGHGVPGAMVSVVCSNALNRAVKEFGLNDTGKILDKTRELVLDTFAKSTDEVKDGMDISLLCVDRKNRQVHWSGANNPLWYIEDNELKEIKADKQPIGKTDYPKPFTSHAIIYKEGTIFYLFTDGYADQFGGPSGKKFKYKQFSELLVQNHEKELKEQSALLQNTFTHWKGELEQVDDVCVIGIKI
jgi:tetratricopeptide (TPR) repeat protein